MLGDLIKSLIRLPRRAGRIRRAKALLETALTQRGDRDFDGARRSFEASIALDPGSAEAHFQLGTMLADDIRSYDAAAVHLERALALDPRIENGWFDLGTVYYFQRDFGRAAASFRAALDADPHSVLARRNLGIALKEGGRLEEALEHLTIAREQAPGAEETLRGLVPALIEADRCDEALSVADDAVERNPHSYEARYFHGLALLKLHEPAQALQSFSQALEMRQDVAELHDNRGTALLELGRLPEAIASYERALALSPDFHLPAFHRALARLQLGDYRRGWDDYELRRRDRDYQERTAAYPAWDGSALSGRTLLVYREQGLGDEIMFASCLPQIIESAAHCVIECAPQLLGIFRRSFPAATVFASTPDGTLPREVTERVIDFAIPAGSLPRFLRKGADDFPRHDGYLKADPQRIAHWREQLCLLGPGIKAGISWMGGVRKTRRGMRSLPLDAWLPILRLPGASFVSLQYTSGARDAAAVFSERHGVPIQHWNEAIDDYEETAALVCALDLVVSVCTAVIHLTGALGRPVWVMAPYSPEWRYGFSGDTMPWYPSAKIFRQPAFGEWDPVTASVASELGRLAGMPGR
jgi:tetratricopeptide (TPR) repeat protein